MEQRTIPQLFEESVNKFNDNILLWQKLSDSYEGLTYAAARERTHKFSAGLISLGLKPGDRVALISEGRNDWVVSELGILFAGAINVPISVKVAELSDLTFRLAHSGCRMVIVSRSQIQKIRQVKGDLPDLEKTLILDALDEYEPDEVYAGDILSEGEDYLASHREEFTTLWKSVKENDPANICYTSGTTADPKGIVLTHRNYTANVEQGSSLVPCPETYATLLILPWDHAFAHTCGIYAMMKNGAALAAIQLGKTPMQTLKNIPENIKEIRPTILLSVPALAKNFRRNIEKGIRDKGPKVEALFNRALKLAYDYNQEGWNKGRGLRLMKKPLLTLYDKILFKKIREKFGGRLECFIGGGALLDIELQRFFYAIGIPMFQGYGLTEAAPIISSNSFRRHKLGSSGWIADKLEVKICGENGEECPRGEQGEIVVKGENVMAGYWKNEKATLDALRDGWLYTGDIGYLDEDGYLYVLGRMKSLLIANDGEKYSPELIEEVVTDHSRYIEQLMLYNNQSPYTVALLVPNKEAIRDWLKENDLSTKAPEGQKAVLALLDGELGTFRKDGKYEGMFPQRWMPTAVAVLGQGFTEDNHFLNSTMKMVRGKITEYYRNRIEFLFTPEAVDICNRQNCNIISRFE